MKKVFKVIKTIIELAIVVAFIAVIVYLFNNGILGNSTYEQAQSKLDTAMKIFASTDMTLEEALNDIEGLESLEIDEENGMYTLVIDGVDFLVISQEIVNGGEVVETTDETSEEEENIEETAEETSEEVQEAE